MKVFFSFRTDNLKSNVVLKQTLDEWMLSPAKQMLGVVPWWRREKKALPGLIIKQCRQERNMLSLKFYMRSGCVSKRLEIGWQSKKCISAWVSTFRIGGPEFLEKVEHIEILSQCVNHNLPLAQAPQILTCSVQSKCGLLIFMKI